jgi:hypothetical protein
MNDVLKKGEIRSREFEAKVKLGRRATCSVAHSEDGHPNCQPRVAAAAARLEQCPDSVSPALNLPALPSPASQGLPGAV